MTRIEQVLKPIAREEVVDATKEYRLLGVRLDGQGPFLRQVITGSQIAATKLFLVYEGDFIYSRLFASRGAFGVVDASLDGCYVSGEFPTFVPMSDRIDLKFLRYWFQLPKTLARVNENCSGSTPLTRNRFKENFFLSLEIPLPPLSAQRRIVARIEELATKIEEAQILRKQAVDEAKALWAHRSAEIFDQMSERFPLRPLNELIAIRGGGTPSKLDPFYWLVHTFPSAVLRVNAAINQDMKALTVNKELIPEFLCALFWAYNPRILQLIEKSTHDTRKLLTEKLLDIKIPVPPLIVQRRFVSELNTLKNEVDTLNGLQTETSEELDALLPSILDEAFRDRG
ncbi:MAG: restriction endonuclease subunit S [Nitrospirae bacterium]|nr:restriction endonuclease subunit S [Nitrospirota bacterium]